VVCERQQRQLFVSVEPGDDTRRPPAEPSGAGIEKDRPRKRRDRHVISMRGSWHRQEPTASNSWGCRRRLLSALCRPSRSGSLGPRRRRSRPAHRPRSCRQGRGRSRGRGPVTAVRSGCRGAEADLRCGAVAACPLMNVDLPLLPRGRPLVAAPMQPCFLLVVAEALEAPSCGSLIELFPRPLDDDERAAAAQRAREPVDHLAGIVHVMKRGRRDRGVESLWKLDLFELDAVVVSGVRRSGSTPTAS
jgi:hypothetical protein